MAAFKNLLLRVHHSIPPEFRKYYGFLGLMVENLKKSFSPVYLASCVERESGEFIKVLYIGWDTKLFQYWLGRFCDEPGDINRQLLIVRWRISHWLLRQKKGADLVFVENPMREESGLDHGFILPVWMEMVIDLQKSLSKSRMRNIVRNIKKYGLTYEIRKDIEDFDLFYRNMYVPFSLQRHGANAEIADYKHFAGKFRNESSMLFFIIADQKSVAGAYVELKENQQRLSAFGILDGSEEYYNQGVLGALYFFIIHYFYERGEDMLLVGNSRPVVFDGVSEYKRQIGAAPYEKDLKGRKKLRFMLMNSSIPVVNILKNNPLYIFNNQYLQMVLFFDEHDFKSKEQFMTFFKRIHPEQVNKLNIIINGSDQLIKKWMMEEGIVHSTFYDSDLLLPSMI